MGDKSPAPATLQIPTIGRIVFYCEPMEPGRACFRPAIVSLVLGVDTVNVGVISALGETYARTGAVYSSRPRPGCWCWPSDAMAGQSNGMSFALNQ